MGNLTQRGIGYVDYAPAVAGIKPQVSSVSSYKPQFVLSDMAELAARLGSPDTHDRRGEVVLFDDFESQNLAVWQAGLAGAGGSFTRSVAAARSGGLSGLLVCGDTIGANNILTHYTPAPARGKIGVEMSFAFGAGVSSVVIANISNRRDGTLHEGYVGYNHAVKIFQVRDENAVWQKQEDMTLYASAYSFNTLKVVIDTDKSKFVRAIVNDRQFDLSGIALRSFADVVPWIWTTFVIVTISSLTDNWIYFDDFILTQNEPAND